MILVTGGAGFIGSVIVYEYNQRDINDIIVVDKIEDHQKNQNLLNLNYSKYIDADDLFCEKYLDLLRKVTVIYHMGACSSTTETNWDFLKENNVEYSKNLFKFATKNNIPITYASSAATYGDGANGYSDNHELINGFTALNLYGKSKQLVDEWVLQQSSFPDVWYGIKFFNVFGPNEYHKGEMRSVVHQAFEQIKDTGKVKLFKSYRDDLKDGEQSRDFIYVKDAVNAMMDLIEKDGGKNCGIYNLGNGVSRTFYDLVRATFIALNREVNVEFVEMPENLKEQYQYYTKAEMDKFFKTLPGFQFLSLEEGVRDYVTKHLEQKNKYLGKKVGYES